MSRNKIVGPPDPRRRPFYNKPRDPKVHYVFQSGDGPNIVHVGMFWFDGRRNFFEIPIQALPHWARHIYRCMKWAQEDKNKTTIVPGVGEIDRYGFRVYRLED